MFELEEVTGGNGSACIKVVGVGGAGGNVINNMIASNIRSVEFIAINTDSQVLETSMASRKNSWPETTRTLLLLHSGQVKSTFGSYVSPHSWQS